MPDLSEKLDKSIYGVSTKELKDLSRDVSDYRSAYAASTEELKNLPKDVLQFVNKITNYKEPFLHRVTQKKFVTGSTVVAIAAYILSLLLPSSADQVLKILTALAAGITFVLS